MVFTLKQQGWDADPTLTSVLSVEKRKKQPKTTSLDNKNKKEKKKTGADCETH